MNYFNTNKLTKGHQIAQSMEGTAQMEMLFWSLETTSGSARKVCHYGGDQLFSEGCAGDQWETWKDMWGGRFIFVRKQAFV